MTAFGRKQPLKISEFRPPERPLSGKADILLRISKRRPACIDEYCSLSSRICRGDTRPKLLQFLALPALVQIDRLLMQGDKITR